MKYIILILAAVLGYTIIIMLYIRRMHQDILDDCIQRIDAVDMRHVNSEIGMMRTLGYKVEVKFGPDGSLLEGCWTKITEFNATCPRETSGSAVVW